MSKTIDLSGKVAIVTGAAQGIGAASARAFAAAGASVLLADISETVADTAANLRETGFVAQSVITDVSDASSCEAMVDRALSEFGRLDYAFNNAGVGSVAVPAGEIDLAIWQRVIDINLTGVFLCVKYQLPAMLANGGGVIVNNSSVLGTRALPRTSIEYTAAKHGVIGLTRQVAVNHAAEGIRCVAVCPGLIETPLIAGDSAMGDEVKSWFMERTPQRRFGQAEDIADAVLMLCSDNARFINGSHLLVDGGLVQG